MKRFIDTPNPATAEAILAIPLSEPERLFADPAALHGEWRSLAAYWHPDRRAAESRATEVFQHLSALYEIARSKAATGEWTMPGMLRLTGIDGRCYDLRYRRQTCFELGDAYVGARLVAYAVDAADLDLFTSAIAAIGGLPFADARMRGEMSGRLPSIKATVATAGRSVLILRKDPDVVALSDLLHHLGGRLDPRHVAWIVSGLESIACYLDWAGLMHGAIAPETVFVSPRRHTVALLGGWWYAKPFGQVIKAIPERTVRLMPPMMMRHRVAGSAIDLECIRQVAREALGDAAGSRLLHDRNVPKPFAQWLAHPPGRTALADYRSWECAREAAFGRRKFTELPVDPAAIYPTI